MNKLLIIGIDSMDSELLSKYIDFMPNFKKLKETTPQFKMESVFPPDSDTAWASIYTGLNPAEHGVVGFVDPLKKSVDIQTKESEADRIRGKTFWDQASDAGKKVIVLLPHIAYPPWEINGFMVSRSRIKNDIKSCPPIKDYDLSKLNTPKGVPKKDFKNLEKLALEYKELVLEEKNFFLKMIKKDWDLFFCYSSALDAIQHYYWNYCDINSPDYIENNPFTDLIKDFYIFYDSMVGDLIHEAGKDAKSIILSDHGHQGRPLKLVNINEILRKHGFLKESSNSSINNSIEGVKSKSVVWISKYNIGWVASKILKIFPKFMDFYISNLSIDLQSSSAYVTDLSGIKSYTYGGIKIKKTEDYERMRDNIIQILKNEIGDLILFISKREEIYSGKYLHKYPDILIQLKDGYGLGNKINVSVVSDAHTSKIVPGSHRGDTPIFFIHDNERKSKKMETIALSDIKRIVLNSIGL